MKTAKSHNDQLTGSVSHEKFWGTIQNPNLRVIEWLPYPENKPTKEGRYLVCHKSGEIFTNTWQEDNRGWYVDGSITAFAELPEAYKP